MKCDSDTNIEIDHIKPVSRYPELEFALDNVQFLCRSCNASKGNRHEMGYEDLVEAHSIERAEGFFKLLLTSLAEQKKEENVKRMD